MTNSNIADQVVEFISSTMDIKPEKVRQESRLLHDLGIDGDDAVGLFKCLHERFGTDLTHLYERWGDHFGPEGIPLSAVLIVIPGALVGGIVAAVMSKVVGDIAATVTGVAAAAVSIAALIWIARKLGLIKNVTPVTVAQIVHAVEAGSWPRSAQD